MNYKWVPLAGKFTAEKQEVIFHGEMVLYDDASKETPSFGVILSDQLFSGGSIETDVVFSETIDGVAAEILFWRNSKGDIMTAGLGGATDSMFTIRHFDGAKWNYLAGGGDRRNLSPNTKYHLKLSVRGSLAFLSVNNVRVLSVTLPFPISQSPAGLWARGHSEVKFSNYICESSRPKAFVIMQFTPPYNELYEDVIKPVCNELGIEAVRADETFGPGLIIADITRYILESKIVIAEITPTNPNVYYEVGYAHGINKPYNFDCRISNQATIRRFPI